jgi:hypothetical protein
MSGPGTYLEKPVDPLNCVRSIQRTLGLEETAVAGEKVSLREEVEKSLRGASSEQLRSALDALRKASKS